MSGIQEELNVAYAPGRRVDLFRPGAPNGCAILWVHGGGWHKGSPEMWHFAARHFAGLGYVCACCDYRLAPAHRFPAQLEDVCAAMAWFRGQADARGFSPCRIAAVGSSAGGHLVALLGTQEEGAARPDAVVCDCPVTLFDGPEAGGELRPARAELLGGTIEEVPEAYRAASPIENVSGGEPPYLFVHGALDKLVSPRHSHAMAERLRAAGVPVEVVIVPDLGHGFAYHDRHAGHTTIYALTHEFLVRVLGHDERG
jgi:acetyl esterase/lipase